MKDGVAAEYTPPQEILKDGNSIFSEIVRHVEAEQKWYVAFVNESIDRDPLLHLANNLPLI
jgi:hypothetical protein